jgi:hypothetical protein
LSQSEYETTQLPFVLIIFCIKKRAFIAVFGGKLEIEKKKIILRVKCFSENYSQTQKMKKPDKNIFNKQKNFKKRSRLKNLKA